MKFIDLIGKRFGKLVIVEKLKERGNRGQVKWLAYCDCGKRTVVRSLPRLFYGSSGIGSSTKRHTIQESDLDRSCTYIIHLEGNNNHGQTFPG